MRKIIILLFVFICCLTSCSNQSIATDKTEKANSPEPVCNATYQLFPTQNMWTFIKLNTIGMDECGKFNMMLKAVNVLK